jgi:hypothetical protein
LLRTWRTEKIPYAKLTWSEISVCTSSVPLCQDQYISTPRSPNFCAWNAPWPVWNEGGVHGTCAGYCFAR